MLRLVSSGLLEASISLNTPAHEAGSIGVPTQNRSCGGGYMLMLSRKLLRYFRPYWKGFIPALVLAGLAIAANLAKPWPLKVLVDDIFTSHPRTGGLEGWLGHLFAGPLSIGQLLVFLAYIAMFYSPLESLSHLAWSLEGAAPAARRVLELLEFPEAVRDRPGAIALASWQGRVEFRTVSFAYKPGSPVLQDVTLSVNPGERVAIVGVSGVGKTTLLNLLLRFYEPTAGQILLDGIEIRELALRSLREHISVVFQENPLLSGTMADNIAYGCPEASRTEIIEAAKAAQAHAFISRLPQGYNTRVGPGGITLSGGECQRLAIARLLKKCPYPGSRRARLCPGFEDGRGDLTEPGSPDERPHHPAHRPSSVAATRRRASAHTGGGPAERCCRKLLTQK
jgi:ABC-type multidrug transport system fused ATPase/permease subunit